MADLSISAANVKVTNLTTANVISTLYVAKVAITAGQSLFRDTSEDPNEWDLLDVTNNETETPPLKQVVSGSAQIAIAVADAAIGQPVTVALKGAIIDLGAGITETLYVGGRMGAGGIMPHEDLLSGDFITIIGWTDGSGDLIFNPLYTGVELA